MAQLHLEPRANMNNKRAVRLVLQMLPENLDLTYDQVMKRTCSQEEDDIELA